ncbi:MAG: hypothetical protein Q9M97_01300, partial [Candidatus Gracilibacteria bacterium]|nr:hypothetical protein [Candidatus Gracilibacteria bacterium]
KILLFLKSLKDSIDIIKKFILLYEITKVKFYLNPVHRISEEIDDNNFSITVLKSGGKYKIPNQL